MTTSVNDAITNAMKALGTLGRTEVPSAQEATDGMACYNALLESWSTEGLASYVMLQVTIPLVVNTQSYTIGSGGAVNTTRPTDIVSAYVRDSNNLDYPMRVVPFDIWDRIGDKNITSQIPDTLYYQSGYPLGTVYIYPIPLVAYNVYARATTQQTSVSAVSTTISMPPGYVRAFTLNLAVEMMTWGFPCLLNDQALARLLENAREARANVKRMNIKEVIAQYDEAIVARSYASYNIYSDMPARG